MLPTRNCGHGLTQQQAATYTMWPLYRWLTCKAGTAAPVPFGFNGKAGGVRQTIQNWLLQGVEGNTSLAAILAAAKPLGHSSKKPVCLMAMLQGGYSPSSATWGTPYVKLVVQPQASK
jgi:hypothetical protein